MKSYHFSLLLAAFFAVASLGAAPLKSPDGHLVVEVGLDAAGTPIYDLKRDAKPVLEESKLGLVLSTADFSKGLKLKAESAETVVKDRYLLLNGKRRINNYAANRKNYEFVTATGRRMFIVFQVSNDGVAFRYVFPEASPDLVTVESEETSFHFSAETKGWLQPMSVAKTFWAKVNPGYEEYHDQEIAVGTPSTLGAGWVFPALFRTGDTWVALTEADLGRGYCATRLRHESPNGEYRIGFPDPRETIGKETVNPQFKTPYATPWRVIAAGSLATVADSTLGTDVAAPAIPSIKLVYGPGKASWSWGKLGDSKTNYDVQHQFIDYAASMNWAYCLVDASWDKQIGYDKIQDLAKYAKTKKVRLILWYNSNGNWNEAPQTPLNLMVDRTVRRKEFARLRDMGVAGVKVDFFGGDGRAFTELYRDILDDAADYGLLVNFHGTTLPRGLGRTYPNFITAEAIRGFEFMDQTGADRAPTHMAMQPFTRNLFDSMDYTPLSLGDFERARLRTTPAAELASAVLFISGIQHYVEIPEVMAKQPDYVQTALREIPSTWEDSRFLTGYPGKLAVFARKGANGRWWIAGFNGENVAKKVEVDLSLLGKVILPEIITDAEGGGFTKKDPHLQGTTFTVELKPYGGFLGMAK